MTRPESTPNGARAVAVIGAGAWGTAVASLLADRVPTRIWARSAAVAEEIGQRHTNATYLGDRVLPSSLSATSSLATALGDAEVVVLAVPSRGMRPVLSEAAALVAPGVPLLSLSKGLEQGSDLRMTEVIDEVWPGHPLSVLAGPNLATEVMDGHPTASVIATADSGVGSLLQELFASERLRVYTNPDLVGCEIAGVVKNVMAIACGMAAGLGFGDNTLGALITRALAELTRLGTALGGEERTFAGLAGLGDLVATCTSAKSRNFTVGVELGRGRPLETALPTRSVAEGVVSARSVLELATRLHVEVPVAREVVAVCEGDRTPAESLAALMGRMPRPEFGPVGSGRR